MNCIPRLPVTALLYHCQRPWSGVCVSVCVCVGWVGGGAGRGGGAGGIYSLIWAIQVCAAPKGFFWSSFGQKQGIDFGHFGLKGYGFFCSSS